MSKVNHELCPSICWTLNCAHLLTFSTQKYTLSLTPCWGYNRGGCGGGWLWPCHRGGVNVKRRSKISSFDCRIIIICVIMWISWLIHFTVYNHHHHHQVSLWISFSINIDFRQSYWPPMKMIIIDGAILCITLIASGWTHINGHKNHDR